MSQKLIYLTERVRGEREGEPLTLSLTAKERTQLRGRRVTLNGTEVMLHLPRGGRLLPGEILKGNNLEQFVVVEAAMEKVLRVRSKSKLELLKAAYHLGNRHVKVEILENELFLLNDAVIFEMLKKLGLKVDIVCQVFSPEDGAYEQ